MTALRVIRLPNGPFKQNCYVLANAKYAVLIDPGSDAPMIHRTLKTEGVTPIAILNTHGHFDHIGAIVDLVKIYDIPFYLHRADVPLIRTANIYRLLFKSDAAISIPTVDCPLEGGTSVLTLGDFTFKIIHTPGHTPGGICLQVGDMLFTGDTLMGTGPGTTKLPGGDAEILETSISQLRELNPDFTVFPGHGRPLRLSEIWERYDAT